MENGDENLVPKLVAYLEAKSKGFTEDVCFTLKPALGFDVAGLRSVYLFFESTANSLVHPESRFGFSACYGYFNRSGAFIRGDSTSPRLTIWLSRCPYEELVKDVSIPKRELL